MVPVLKYYSYNPTPNDEELQSCINIAEKSKSVVLLYYACRGLTNDTDVNHVFIHSDDTVASLKLRISAGYRLL